MATKRKKKETPDTPVKETVVWPKVTVGTHLTVTEYEDGSAELKWDDAALQRECEEAIASVSK